MQLVAKDRWVKIAWLLTSYSTTIAISSFSANYDHYTWWSIASFSIYALLGLGDVEHLYFWLIVGIQLQVVLGVVIMGNLLRCDVFVKAHDDNGFWMYIVGNFAMHFLPLLEIVLLAYKFDTNPHRLCVAFLVSYAIYSDWEQFNDPIDVYDCDVPMGVRFAVPAASPVVACIAAATGAVVVSRLPSKINPF